MEKSVEDLIEKMYQDNAIHFLMQPESKNVMVNATDMAKMFDKPVDKFLRLRGTKIFIKELLVHENEKIVSKIGFAPPDVGEQNDFVPSHVSEQNKNIPSHLRVYLTETDIIYGTNKATFMHRKLAIKFAAWLSVKFEIWMIDIVDEILNKVIYKRLSLLEYGKEESDEKEELLEKVKESEEYKRIKEIEANARTRNKALKKLDADLLAGQTTLDI